MKLRKQRKRVLIVEIIFMSIETKMAQHEHDELIRKQNFRDHLQEMFNGMEALNKMPKTSNYGDEYGKQIL
jgi:hypothetical protein